MALTQTRHAAPRAAARILLLTLVAVLALGAAFPAAARAASTGILSARVVLRKSADEESKALQTLPQGDEVDVLSTSGSWYKVSYGKYTGYVMKKYVTVSKKSVAANADKIEALGDAPGAMPEDDDEWRLPAKVEKSHDTMALLAEMAERAERLAA